MEKIEKLYIEAHKEDVESKDIRFENLGYFFDIKSGIGVQKKYIESDLKVGFVYDLFGKKIILFGKPVKGHSFNSIESYLEYKARQ